jgi:hypothetical protein
MVMAKKYNSVQGKLRKGGGKGLSGDALVGRVSQATIDDIKRMGMTKALKLAGKNGKTSGGMAREFQEGVRRMYGARRLTEAKAKYAPVKSKSADAARAGATKPMASKPTANKPANKPATKSNSNFGKAVAGLYGAAAVGALVASKGKGAKLASKLSPGLAKSAVGKALMGSTPKLSPAQLAKLKKAQGAKAAAAKVTVGPKGSFGKTTLTNAKSGLGTASEYASKAGQASARASIKAKSPDAARAQAAKTASKKTTTVSKKKVTKAGIAASGAGQTKK